MTQRITLPAWGARPNIARSLYLCAVLASAGAAAYFVSREPAHFRGYCYSVG